MNLPDLTPIRQQEMRLEAFRSAILEAAKEHRQLRHERGLLKTQEQLRAMLQDTREEDMASLATQLHLHASLSQHQGYALPDLDNPYFGFLRLREKNRIREIYIGERAFLDADTGLSLVNWRESAYGDLFFDHQEGEVYELDLPDRTVEGVIEAKQILQVRNGQLESLYTATDAYVRESGAWTAQQAAVRYPFQGGAGSTAVAHATETHTVQGMQPIVDLLLDPHQREVVDASPDAPLLVLGSAGSGKTTVALHRLLQLHRKDPVRFAEEKLLVLVPEVGLQHLTRKLLRELGLPGVRVEKMESWLEAEGRRIFPSLPTRINHHPPASVARWKGHEAMEAVCRAYVQRLERWTYWKTWNVPRMEIFCEPSLLRVALEVAPGVFSPEVMEQVQRHTRLQFSQDEKKRYARFHAESLKTSDGKSLDANTPQALAGSIDCEDFAVLMRLLYLQTGEVRTREGALSRYAHIVLDEAQEYSAMELKAVSMALGRNKSLTVAGDDVQQMDPTSPFQGWQRTLSQFGVQEEEALAHRLRISYRSPRPIMELGLAVLGALAPKEPPVCTREGAPVTYMATGSLGESVARMADVLLALYRREPQATVAVVCQSPETAQIVAARLAGIPQVRWVRDGEFGFRAGVEVTDVYQVKGLEFDYVVLPDVSGEAYPDTPLARRQLHVAVTRAVHQLWVLSSGEISKLLLPLPPPPVS